MIRRIELTNFMSHEHTVLVPAAGLTVLVGPNNCGKSAVVAALQILTNNADSNYVMRHGCKECSVVVETDDGHRVEWRRKTAPSYLIDDTKFDRLGRGNVPAELAPALRLKKVEGTDDDIHFGEQKSPLFLIDKPAAHAAKFFAASSDVSRLVAMQTRHRTKHSDAKKRKNELEAKSAQVTKELDTLAPLTNLDQQLEQQEAAYLELGRLAEELQEAIRLEADLIRANRQLAQLTAATDALLPLAPPPLLVPTAPLVQLLTNLSKEQRTNDQESQRASVLVKLQPPPTLDDTDKLAKLIERLNAAGRSLNEYQQRRSALATLVPPPQLTDTAALETLILRLHDANRAEQRAAAALQSLAALAPLPAIANEQPLQATLNALETGARKLEHCERQVSALNQLAPAPAMNDPAPLAEFLKLFDKQTSELYQREMELIAAQAEFLIAEEHLRGWAFEQQTCPTCGGALDPERLLSTLCTGGPGGGAHG